MHISSGSEGAAGHDLASCENIVVPARDVRGVRTGLTVAFPPGAFGLLYGRSGLSLRNTDVAATVIDPDYTGKEIKAIYT